MNRQQVHGLEGVVVLFQQGKIQEVGAVKFANGSNKEQGIIPGILQIFEQYQVETFIQFNIRGDRAFQIFDSKAPTFFSIGYTGRSLNEGPAGVFLFPHPFQAFYRFHVFFGYKGMQGFQITAL